MNSDSPSINFTPNPCFLSAGGPRQSKDKVTCFELIYDYVYKLKINNLCCYPYCYNALERSNTPCCRKLTLFLMGGGWLILSRFFKC